MWMGPWEFLVMGIPSHRSSTTYLTINVENANAWLCLPSFAKNETK